MTGIILAGGRSQRMGENKAFLLVQGQRIIDRICTLFKPLFEEILLVTNTPLEYFDLRLRTVSDLFPGCGSLGGIYTGLFFASHPRAFVAACDMPFLQAQVIQYLKKLSPSFDMVIPRTPDGLQPLHAIYAQRCLPFMEALLRQGNCRIADFFPKVKKREVLPEELLALDPQLQSFINLNTPEDRSLLESRIREAPR